MNWTRLKTYKCPKCETGHLEKNDYGHQCHRPFDDCGFVIRKDKFDEILQHLYQRSRRLRLGIYKPEEDNLSMLNNL